MQGLKSKTVSGCDIFVYLKLPLFHYRLISLVPVDTTDMKICSSSAIRNDFAKSLLVNSPIYVRSSHTESVKADYSNV